MRCLMVVDLIEACCLGLFLVGIAVLAHPVVGGLIG